MLENVLALMVFGTLAASGGGHLIHRRAFEAALASHRLWERGVVPLLASAVAAAETLIGVMGLLSYGGAADRSWTGAFLLAAVATLAAFTAYAVVLLRFRPASSCGCSRRHDAISGWVVGRASALTAGAAYAAWAAHQGALPSLGVVENMAAALAAAGFGILLWTLPEALGRESGWMTDEMGGRIWT